MSSTSSQALALPSVCGADRCIACCYAPAQAAEEAELNKQAIQAPPRRRQRLVAADSADKVSLLLESIVCRDHNTTMLIHS